MANYKYDRGKVIENKTGYTLAKTDKKTAINLVNWLNAGGAFNGYTPRFFIDKSIQHINTLKKERLYGKKYTQDDSQRRRVCN